jgi:RHS repeat-associated protein
VRVVGGVVAMRGMAWVAFSIAAVAMLLVLPGAGAVEQRQLVSSVADDAAFRSGSVPARGRSDGSTHARGAKGPEVVGLRTRTSRTFAAPGGSRVTEVHAEPVNYRAADGGWAAIDSTLVAGADGSFANRSNSYSVELPPRLGEGAVRVAEGSAWAEFSLIGADVPGVADGPLVTYEDAAPGVTARYTVLGDSVKEELVLEGRDATREFSFSLVLPDGFTARQVGQPIEVVGPNGGVPFGIEAPFAADAAGAHGRVTQKLRRVDGEWIIDVSVDREWLDQRDRRFPVVVDPTIDFSWPPSPDDLSALRDCTLNQAAPSTSVCGDSSLWVGRSAGARRRAVLQFDVANALPERVEVLNAELELHLLDDHGAPDTDVNAHRLTASFGGSATWNSRATGSAWASAGGDFVAEAAAPGDDVGYLGDGEDHWWAPVELVQAWVDGDQVNHGLLLKTGEQAPSHLLQFASSEHANAGKRPELEVTWMPRIGQRRQWTFEEQQLWDRAGAGVNVANGNLLLEQQDARIAGTGLDLDVTRFYNGQSDNWHDVAHGWTLNYGGAVGIQRFWDYSRGESAVLAGPSGDAVRFQREPGGDYRPPSGIDAKLVEKPDDSFELTFDKTGEKMLFDKEGWLTERRDRNGNAISYELDAGGNPVSITDTQGREIEFDTNGDGQVVEMSDWTGREWEYEVDDGLLDSYTDPDGGVTEYGYDYDLNLTEIVDPNGNETTFDYDADERVTEIVRVTNPVAATGPTWTFDYNAGNTVVTDPRGKETTYSYDNSLRVTQVEDDDGNLRSTTYTSNSDPQSMTAPGSAATAFGYDSLGNLISMTEPAGEVTAFEYGSGSHPRLPTKETSPQGTSSVFAYDPAGNTTAVADGGSPTQVEEKLEYNGQAGGSCADDTTTMPGTLRCVIDGQGNETRYGYDDAGNLTTITPELPLGETTISYDALSRVDTVEDGEGHVASYGYDTLDRVVEIDYGGGETVSFDYDANGNRIERVDSVHGTSTWAYDVLNRRTADDLPSGETDYTWDVSSNLTSLTDAGGTVTYRYDDVNRLADLAEPGGSCSSPVSLCTTFGYTERDQRERTTYPNGVEQTVTYDASDKPTRVQALDGATELSDVTYDYDEPSPGTRHTKLRQSVTDEDGNETTYAYDFLDRLTGAVQRDGSDAVVDERSYEYDLASNRTQQVINGTARSFAYNAANQLCWAFTGVSVAGCDSPPSGAVTYNYDANGDTTASSAGWDFGYDDRARTTNLTWPGEDLAIDFGRTAAERSGSGVTGGDRHNTLLGLSREDTTSWTRDPDGTLISQRASGGDRHYYLSDALGSIVGLIDTGGDLTRSYAYDPFGRLRANSGDTPNPFMFAGEYREPENDVYRIGDRFYAAAVGRWAQIGSQDRAGDLQKGNRYLYEGSDPVNPSGMAVTSDVEAGQAAVERHVEFDSPPEEPDEPEEPEEPEAPPLSETGVTPLDEATEFLYTGADPRQTGVAPGTVEPARVAVIRGVVRNTAGGALADVQVTIADHPEYGATTTDADGEFAMAVNGGGQLTVRLQHEGYLTVDRSVDVPWQDYVWVDDVVMTALDPNANAIDLSSPLAPQQVARGSVETDADGARQATLIVPAGTSAEMVMPNGTELPLEELTVRMTEYTVGEDGEQAMPADLPPMSGYTYAAEYSVDEAMAAGAVEVRFDRPLANYTENFLDFPVGSEVPTGYYDRQREAWVSAPNGRVVEVLSETSGMADLDVTGSGQPATTGELLALGVTDDERAELADLYGPGASLWRVAIEHFTPWDHNWPWAPDEDAVPPNRRLPPPQPDRSCTSGGSVIECENQILGEDLPLVGSEQQLHYRSDRVPGRVAARTVDIPLVGASVPVTLVRIDLTVDVAGQRLEESFEPVADLDYSFVWNGRDGFGRRVNGAQLATIEIDYVYDLIQYLEPEGWARAWGRPGRPMVMSPRPREMSLSQTMTTTFGGIGETPTDLGGWSLSSHHRYDPIGKVLYLGDGRRRSADNIGLVARRVAGQVGDPEESTGDGGPAREATMGYPEDLDVAADGSVYFADSNNARIRRIAPDGTIDTVAGTGEFRDYGEPAGDGGPAIEAELNYPYGLDVAADGSVYFTDWNRVRRIDPAGIITTVAGNEVDSFDPGFAGDGGPATDANFDLLDGIAVAPDGSFYVIDYYNHRLRHVGTDGIVETVAGTGTPGFSGDGGPASQAQIDSPEAVEIAPDGSVYVADQGNQRVRRIGTDGVIETVLGGGSGTVGVPGTESEISGPGIAIAADGTLLITDVGYVYQVAGDGVIRKLGGVPCSSPDPCPGNVGDGVAARDTDLGCPVSLATGQARDIYVSDVCYHTIRRLKPTLPDFDSTEIAIPSEDASEIYEFDATGVHLRTVDALTGGTLYSFSHDSQGRLLAIEDGDELETTVERDSEGVPTAIVAPFGQRTALGQDEDGYLASIVNPADEEIALGYGEGGLLAAFTTADDHETSFTYDAGGRLTRDTDAAGGFKDLTRLTADDRTEVTLTTKLGRASKFEVERLPDDDIRRTWTDPSGLERSLLIRGDGSLEGASADGVATESETGADPRFGAQSPVSASRVIETPDGRRMDVQGGRDVALAEPGEPLSLTSLEETLSVNGHEATTVFDSALDQFTSTSPEGRTATTTVDDQRRPLSTAVSGVTPVAYARDASGRVEQVAQGARTLDFAYDAAGRVERVTDALDRAHEFEYDDADRVVKEILPDLREIAFGYDDDGNLTSVTPPSRPAHAFDYTPLGQTDAYTPPDLGGGAQLTTFEWSDDRELTEISKPGGRTVGFGYDAGGRLETVSHSGGETDYGYDPLTGGLAFAETATAERTEFDWDGFLPLSETTSGTVAGEVSRTYDDDFHVVSESIDGGHSVAFDYDDDGLLIEAGGLSLERDSGNGLLAGAEQGVVTTEVERDDFGDPETVSSLAGATVLYEEEYERDDLGRVVQKVERRGATATTYEYGYDVGGRLETVTKDSVLAATYDYDANGNRVGVDRTGELPIVGQYDDQDRLTDYGSVTYDHDASGQLVEKVDGSDTTTYDYDDLGALTGVSLPNGDEIDYAVDAEGRRVAKKLDGVLTQGFLYGRGLAPAAELDGNGDVLSRFVYGTRPNVPEYMVRGGQTYRILADQLGSPRAVVDVSTGAVAQQMDFDEFGRVTNDTNPGFQPFGFAGGLYDSDTGLVRFGARDYDPDTGRWTTKDPIGFAGGDTNLYGYVLGDPINLTDPSGLFGLPGIVEDGFSAALNVVDAAVPDPASEFSAGLLDGATFGMTSSILDVEGACWGAGYALGSFAAPGPGKLKVGLRALGISKTVRVDRTGRPVPAPKELGTVIGDRRQAMQKSADALNKELGVKGAPATQNKRSVLEGLRHAAGTLDDIGF